MNKVQLQQEIQLIEQELAQIKNILFEANVTQAMMVQLGRQKSVLLESRKDDLNKLGGANG